MFNNRKVKHLEVMVKIISEKLMDLQNPYKFEIGEKVVVLRINTGHYAEPVTIDTGVVVNRSYRYWYSHLERSNNYDVFNKDKTFNVNEVHLQPK